MRKNTRWSLALGLPLATYLSATACGSEATDSDAAPGDASADRFGDALAVGAADSSAPAGDGRDVAVPDATVDAAGGDGAVGSPLRLDWSLAYVQGDGVSCEEAGTPTVE